MTTCSWCQIGKPIWTLCSVFTVIRVCVCAYAWWSCSAHTTECNCSNSRPIKVNWSNLAEDFGHTKTVFSMICTVGINYQGFSSGSDGKESACSAGNPGSVLGKRSERSERSLGEGNGNPLQCSCLKNCMDRGPGGLQFMGSQKVRHDWVTNSFTLKPI